MRALVILLCVLCVPTLALAQGGPPPLPPLVTPPAEAQQYEAQHPRDPAQVRALRAGRETRLRQLPGFDEARSRSAPKPPDAIPSNLRNNPPSPTWPTGPRPPDPPRRSEEPALRLLGLSSQTSDIYCGSGTQSYQNWDTTIAVRGYMFCHDPLSFFSEQSQVLVPTTYSCGSAGCFEVAFDPLVSCGRWAYDWQGWYCPYDPDYAHDAPPCGNWSRVINYIYGRSPSGSSFYYNTSTPWRVGCQFA